MLGKETGGEYQRAELLRAQVQLSPALCKTETNWSKLESQRGRVSVRSSWLPPAVFWHYCMPFTLLPALRTSSLGSWSAKLRPPSLPKAVLPLHFSAQVHWVRHCLACGCRKLRQASQSCLHPTGKSPKETASPLPTYTDQELPTFWPCVELRSFICLL